MPRRFVFQSLSRKPLPAGAVPQPVQTHTSEVTHLSGDPMPPEVFALAYNAPGTRVYVHEDEGRQVAYEVKEDGTLAPVSRGGVRGREDETEIPRVRESSLVAPHASAGGGAPSA